MSLLLTQFIFRLSFGVAVAMAVTPSRFVTSGFYRVHLWVVMGLNTFAALAVYSAADYPNQTKVMVLVIGATVGSFIGSVLWLYENRFFGGLALYFVALMSLAAAFLAIDVPASAPEQNIMLMMADLISGGLLLGVTLSAMLLGHWYLNTPTMELLPLKRLVMLMAAAIIARTILCGMCLVYHLQAEGSPEFNIWAFLALRWLSGFIGTLALAWMAWLTLKVPNTQSATGILYASVILAFMGELTSKLLSVDKLYPL